MKKKAIIIGAGGQDGRLLRSYLESKNYIILSVFRDRNMCCSDNGVWPHLDISCYESVLAVIQKFMPHEIYYLAAHHASSESLDLSNPHELWNDSYQVNVTGFLNVMEAVRVTASLIKLFYASSCMVFSSSKRELQDEKTSFSPNSIYGLTKSVATNLSRYYRDQYGMFVSVGILYNHESCLRPDHFASQKIIKGALKIKSGDSSFLPMGDISVEVDWGYAPDYVRAMHLILELSSPEDFIIASGKTHSVREFLQIAFAKVGLNWVDHVKVDGEILQRSRSYLCGDASKLIRMTGWQPSVSFDKMIDNMIKGIY